MRAKQLTIAMVLTLLFALVANRSTAQNAPALRTIAAAQPGRHITIAQAPAAALPARGSSTQAVTTTTVLSENFEGAWPASPWQLNDQSSLSGADYLWGKRECQPFAGAYSGMAVGGGTLGQNRSCTSDYPNRADSWAIYGPIDLSNAISTTMTFYIRGESEGTLETPIDFAFVGSNTSLNGQYSGFPIAGRYSDGYYRVLVDFNDRLGQSQVWIAFAFISNATQTYAGFTIDDIQLDVVSNASSTATPTTTSTPTETSTPTTTSTPTETSTPTATSTPTITSTPPETPLIQPTATRETFPNPNIRLPLLIYTFAPPDCPGTGANTLATLSVPIIPDGRLCRGSFRSQAEKTSQWFSADVGAGQTITVDLTDIPSGADYDIYLFDAQVLNSSTAQYIAYSNKDGNADEQLTFQSQIAARYYLRVVLSTKTNAAPNSYLLAVMNH